MKKILLFALFLATSMVAIANPVSESQAKSIAASFFAARKVSGAKAMSSASVTMMPALTSVLTRNQGNPAYYIFNSTSTLNKGAYVIISGDDQLPQLLSYSLDGTWPADESLVPTPLKNALKNYSAYVEALRSGAVEAPVISHTDSQGTPVVGPLLATKWNQSYPFNKYAPECPDTMFASRFCGHFPIGCVAIGMAQIINYWGQKTGRPVNPANHDTYGFYIDYFKANHPHKIVYYTLSENTKYAWRDMPDSIGHRPDTVKVMPQDEWEKEGEAAAVLLRDVALSMNMYWYNSGGGADNTYSADILTSIFDFSYDSRYIFTKGYGQMNNYLDLIKADLDKGWPVLAAGYDFSDDGGGHCFVYDGYDSKDYIHVNWGWGGECDAFFDLNYLKTDIYDTRAKHSYNFSTNQDITIGIHPRAEGETPRLDNNNIQLDGVGFSCDGLQGTAISNLEDTTFVDGTKPVAYLDKDVNRFNEYCEAKALHKSAGYDYDMRLDLVNKGGAVVACDTVRNTTMKEPSPNISGVINMSTNLSTSGLADGKYFANAGMREVLNGETSDWIKLERYDSVLINGKHVVMTPDSYNNYYHGRQCAHIWQDKFNNALFHMEFTKNPEKICVGDSMNIVFEEQIAAARDLKYDSTLISKPVLITMYEDGQEKPDILLDNTDRMNSFLQTAKTKILSYDAYAWQIPFKAEEKYAGKTLHVTYSWPAFGVSMTNDIKVRPATGIEVVNIENHAVQDYLADRTYEESGVPSDSSVISKYYDTAKYGNYLDHPHGKVVSWTPTVSSSEIKEIDVFLSTKKDYSRAAISHPLTLDATTDTICNMLPGRIYYYKVVEVQKSGIRTIVTSGRFKTEGQLRMISVDGVRNVRDLGGWQTSFGVPVKYGKIYRSGKLDDVSALGIQQYHVNVGIGAELDLRDNSTLTASPLGADVNFAVIGIKQYYEGIISEAEQGSLVGDLRFIIRQLRSKKPVDFHCMVGCDRTGTLAFLLEGLLGVCQNDIDRDYELSSFAADARGSHVCPRNYNGHLGSYTKMMPYIKTFGPDDNLAQCFYNYWTEIGVTTDELDYFRQEMLGIKPTAINVVSGTTNTCQTPSRIYSVDGIQRQSLSKGLNIVLTADGKLKKVMIYK